MVAASFRKDNLNMAGPEVDPALKELVEANKKYFSITPEGKVKCEINGHTFPPKLEVVKAFIKCVGSGGASKQGFVGLRRAASGAWAPGPGSCLLAKPCHP